MVRLKEIPFSGAYEFEFEFQFQYGSIKSSLIVNGYYFRKYFNSSMVRLKVQQEIVLFYYYPNFNSSMVRLKGNTGRTNEYTTNISIPVWFD